MDRRASGDAEEHRKRPVAPVRIGGRPSGDPREVVIRILLVEDDTDLSRRLSRHLGGEGFAVDAARDGREALDFSRAHDYDAAVLDLGLPEMSGLEVLRNWRATRQKFPVIILTARTGWSERVNGLNAGADDYLEKPFHADELIARLRVHLRRHSGLSDPVLKHGDLEFDTTTSAVSQRGTPVELTARELQILSYLLHRAGRIVSQSELIGRLYSADESPSPNTIEVYIARLRRKLGHDVIVTVRGLGYKMTKGGS